MTAPARSTVSVSACKFDFRLTRRVRPTPKPLLISDVKGRANPLGEPLISMRECSVALDVNEVFRGVAGFLLEGGVLA
jgi:hypothetical protein